MVQVAFRQVSNVERASSVVDTGLELPDLFKVQTVPFAPGFVVKDAALSHCKFHIRGLFSRSLK